MQNPESNKLGEGLDLESLASAVAISGYPLQIEIARQLSDEYSIEHEWSFVDPQTGQTRTLDILANLMLYNTADGKRVYPAANALIECKQSVMPHIFFPADGPPPSSSTPILAGLFDDTVNIHYGKGFELIARVADMIVPSDHPYLTTPHFCYTFSKAARKGKSLELCGSDAYQSLILPLVKSLSHFKSARKPRSTYLYLSLEMAFAIGVIDGPMLVAKQGRLEFTPWVRVYRHEHVHVEDGPAFGTRFAIDLVHKDYLTEFLDTYLKPFAEAIAERSIKHHVVLAEREGLAPQGWLRNSYDDIVPVQVERDEQMVRIDDIRRH
ncbi:hypothetical protein [Sphingomonas sp. STIS6.2]|uniref:hypothetical protein n=1 Tax=Sphingomonas sp. STIS6.2 TaxID=1379700 RepID=UPI00131B2049|nr:hypothetical protein [Sphingomonas sp. STIS6.2]